MRYPDLCDIYPHGFCVAFFPGRSSGTSRGNASADCAKRQLAGTVYRCRLEVYQLAFATGVLLVVDILHESGISIRVWLAKQVLVVRWSIYMLVLLGFVVLLLQNYGRAAAEFLYFQF